MSPRKGSKPPVPGAVRCYPLAPADHEDPFAFIAGRLKARGLEALTEGFGTVEGGELWIMFQVWAVPTETEEEGVA